MENLFKLNTAGFYVTVEGQILQKLCTLPEEEYEWLEIGFYNHEDDSITKYPEHVNSFKLRGIE